MSKHVENIVAQSSQTLYALKILKEHGMRGTSLTSVFNAVCLSRLTYASQSWRGYASSSNFDRIRSVLNKAARWGLTGEQSPKNLTQILDKEDKNLFLKTKTNNSHVLHSLLPPVKNVPYNLRRNAHSYELPIKTHPQSKNFLYRMLYANIY